MKRMAFARLNLVNLSRKKVIVEVEVSKIADVFAKTINSIKQTCDRV
jgi:hypothetical protein